ncbi:beta-carotene 15,15'-monooxygenase [Paenisporosarcina quisquiliarum]|uniref:Beta-carotene 15,15'-monooxygenase n=1 Tax=Paenisporosarcina quisquiliarum TaxID=365346 RepID=A0A9X3LJG4_9BACL|nr:beta-carotene 15,15'-monooxygenase [Paenisporosarcina quisquiliarum]MCZ8538101.1 beta-carotene 15,15'-monooxygenase [Paenisporosarcina quisquiliarum]
MVAKRLSRNQVILFTFLVLILLSNFALYRTPSIPISINDETQWVVLGSLIDLAIIAPIIILFLTRHKGITLKRFIPLMAIGLIASNFFIPKMYFQHLQIIAYIGIAYEIILFGMELFLVVLLIRHISAIRRDTKNSDYPWLFAFPAAVKKRVGDHVLIRILISEMIMLVYAFGSWRNKQVAESNSFTLHKNSSVIAFYAMLIHAIVFESIGFHWFLHEKSFLLSIVLLILNIYTVVYFIGEIQAIRLNPLRFHKDGLSVSLGLTKKIFIPYVDIKQHQWGKALIPSKETLEFIANDLEKQPPHVILTFYKPLEATMFMGMKKEFTHVAIRVDEPERLKSKFEEQMVKWSVENHHE